MRETVKFPLYWGTLIQNLKDKEAGRLFKAIFDYVIDGIEPTKDKLHGAEWAVWPIMKRDLDWQVEHHRSCRYPENEKMAIRNSMEYRDWRKAVYERDGYTCQICGKRGGNLNAHHIKHFAQYPELRMDITNGITLCYDCHRAVHRGEIMIV